MLIQAPIISFRCFSWFRLDFCLNEGNKMNYLSFCLFDWLLSSPEFYFMMKNKYHEAMFSCSDWTVECKHPSVRPFVSGNCWVPYWDIFPTAQNIGVCVQMRLKTHYPPPSLLPLTCWSHESLTLDSGHQLEPGPCHNSFLNFRHFLHLINKTFPRFYWKNIKLTFSAWILYIFYVMILLIT